MIDLSKLRAWDRGGYVIDAIEEHSAWVLGKDGSRRTSISDYYHVDTHAEADARCSELNAAMNDTNEPTATQVPKEVSDAIIVLCNSPDDEDMEFELRDAILAYGRERYEAGRHSVDDERRDYFMGGWVAASQSLPSGTTLPSEDEDIIYLYYSDMGPRIHEARARRAKGE